MTRLLHYANTVVKSVYSVTQELSGSYYAKPTGLWVSVEGDDDWRSWCEAESFGNVAAQICHEVTLVPDAKILRITADAQLRRFAKQYEYDPYMHLAAPTYYSRMGVDWMRVAEKYEGIIIAPYQWDCRLDPKTNWYYGWDCASGCIWNARAVARIRVVEAIPQRARSESGVVEVRPEK